MVSALTVIEVKPETEDLRPLGHSGEFVVIALSQKEKLDSLWPISRAVE